MILMTGGRPYPGCMALLGEDWHEASHWCQGGRDFYVEVWDGAKTTLTHLCAEHTVEVCAWEGFVFMRPFAEVTT